MEKWELWRLIACELGEVRQLERAIDYARELRQLQYGNDSLPYPTAKDLSSFATVLEMIVRQFPPENDV